MERVYSTTEPWADSRLSPVPTNSANCHALSATGAANPMKATPTSSPVRRVSKSTTMTNMARAASASSGETRYRS